MLAEEVLGNTQASHGRAASAKSNGMASERDTKSRFQIRHECRDDYEEANQIECEPLTWNLESSSALYDGSASRGVTSYHDNVHGEGAQHAARMQVHPTCRDRDAHHIAMGQHLPVQQVNEGAMYSTSTSGAFSSFEANFQLRQSVLQNATNIQTMLNVPNSRSISSQHLTNNTIGPALPPISMIDGERLWACHLHWLQPGEQLLPDPDFDTLLASLP